MFLLISPVLQSSQSLQCLQQLAMLLISAAHWTCRLCRVSCDGGGMLDDHSRPARAQVAHSCQWPGLSSTCLSSHPGPHCLATTPHHWSQDTGEPVTVAPGADCTMLSCVWGAQSFSSPLTQPHPPIVSSSNDPGINRISLKLPTTQPFLYHDWILIKFAVPLSRLIKTIFTSLLPNSENRNHMIHQARPDLVEAVNVSGYPNVWFYLSLHYSWGIIILCIKFSAPV